MSESEEKGKENCERAKKKRNERRKKQEIKLNGIQMHRISYRSLGDSLTSSKFSDPPLLPLTFYSLILVWVQQITECYILHIKHVQHNTHETNTLCELTTTVHNLVCIMCIYELGDLIKKKTKYNNNKNQPNEIQQNNTVLKNLS